MINTIIDWVLANPKTLTVLGGLVVAIIEAWRQRSKGQAARDALDLVNNQLREQGYTRLETMKTASEALQARSRKKAAGLRELQGSNIRLDTDTTAAWVREQAAKLKGKGNDA